MKRYSAGGETREVEWQLTAPDLSVVRHWVEQHRVLGDLSIAPLPVQRLHDTYLDTGDWCVLRAGFSLRLREKAGHVEATLKGLRSARDDVADRREITEPLSGRTAKTLARATGPVGTRVRDVVGVKPLRTLFEVQTARQRFAVRSRHAAAAVGEIALDEARFPRADGHRRPMVLTRIELEVIGCDSAPLARLAKRLQAECGLHRATESKFAVGLRAASLEPPRDATPGRKAEPAPAPMAASIRARDFAAEVLRRLLHEWHINEPAARLGEDPEPLHELRVTGRRMDTVLSLFRGYLPASVGKSRPILKRLLDALGTVRDVDIRLEAVSTFRGTLPKGDRPALGPLLQHLLAERTLARARMLRALDAKPTRRWLDALADQLVRTVPATFSASSRSGAALIVVPSMIRKRYRKLRKCAGRLTADSSMSAFHKARVRAKKLRYALEVVAPAYGKPADEMLDALNELQSRLGAQHDAYMLCRYLTRLAAHPPADFTAATLFTMGGMARHAAEAARMGRKAQKPWRKVHGRHWKLLRSRMQELRDDALEGNSKMDGSHRGGGGNGKLVGVGGNATAHGTSILRRGLPELTIQ